MERVKLTSKVEISRLIYGMWRLGDDEDTSPGYVQQKIEACLEQGITTIDQADIYGGYRAEKILGDCLAQSPQLKEKIEIITKCGIVAPVGKYADRRVKYYDTSPAHIRASVEASLVNMRTACLDLLLIHRPDPFMNHHETAACLDALIASGKVRAIGVSNFKPHDINLLSSALSNPIVTNQIEISLASTDALTNGDMAFLQQKNIRPMAWSPLGGGAMFLQPATSLMERITDIAQENNVDAAAVIVAWLLAHPAYIVPVMGTNSLARIKILSQAYTVKMDPQTWFELYSLARGVEVP